MKPGEVTSNQNAMEEAKKKAAEKMRQLCRWEPKNDWMLATVQAVKAQEEDRNDELEKQRKAYSGNKWRQPVDWRLVTEANLHKYIPFDEPDINQAVAVRYVKARLLQCSK